MAHREDFRMELIKEPETLAACDVCTNFCPIGEPRFRTFIATTPQSDICIDCGKAVAALITKSRIPAEPRLRVEAVA